jgi:hypothetical protein
MRKTSALLFSSLFSGFAGCASSDDDEIRTVDDFCERWAAAACSTEVVSACQAADAESCQESQFAFCARGLPGEGFSGARAERCIDAVEAAYEDADITSDELGTVLRFAAPCDGLVRGPRESGEVCQSLRDCNAPGGFECVFKGAQSTGVCAVPERVGPGQDCSEPNAVCDSGFYCNGENCIAGEGTGEPCANTTQCGASDYCGSTSVCEPRRAVDATCGFDEQCASGLCYQFSVTDQVCTDRLRLSRNEPICEDLR